MGTDIHMTVEVRVPTYRYEGDDGDERQVEWQRVSYPFRDDYWYGVSMAEPDNKTARQYAYSMLHPYGGRNYVLFGVLGNVRNGSGFAGIDTGDPVTPCVGAKRGLPADVDGDPDSFEYGEHSFGWATLTELLEYDWNASIVKRGVISLDQYLEENWREDGPLTWSGGVAGRDIVTYEDEEALRLAIKQGLPEGQQTFVKVQWTSDLTVYCQRFIEVLHFLKELLSDFDTDDVRLVYGFDS